MTETTHAMLLRRKTRVQVDDVAENPLTSSRAVRLALIKAANDTVGLKLTVSSIAEDVSALDVMLDGLPDGLLLVGLHRDDALVGVIGMDMQLRAAMLEMQTVGTVATQPAEDRVATRADRMLCNPMIIAFLRMFPDAVNGTAFEGWGDALDLAETIADKRAAGLQLSDGQYRLVQMNIDLGVSERQGMLTLVLPFADKPENAAPFSPKTPDWNAAFQTTVGAAPARVTAELHRFDVPLVVAQNLEVGGVLPLTGCTVGSIKLRAPDGRMVATAKLGQSGGMRAVKLQAPPVADLQDFAPQSGAKVQVDAVSDQSMVTVNADPIETAARSYSDAAAMPAIGSPVPEPETI